MRPINIFFHTCFNLGNQDHAIAIFQEQIRALEACGVLEVAEFLFIGLNGDECDEVMLRSLLPIKTNITVFLNQKSTWESGEVPTLNILRELLPDLVGSDILYFHMKGLTHVPASHTFFANQQWRRSMEHIVIWNWRECVDFLRQGYDVVGHRWYNSPTGNYFAGNFWWAKSEFLKTLPEIKPQGHLAGGRYEAEVWIGRGSTPPMVVSL